jgi:hypothetical protein
MNDLAIFRRLAAIEQSRRAEDRLRQLKDKSRVIPPRPAQGRFPYFTKGSAHA